MHIQSWWWIAGVGCLAAIPGLTRAAEITEVIDAVDDNDPFDINIDVSFHSSLERAKITHEWKTAWVSPQYANRPDFNELRYERQLYAMDYTIEIGLYRDLQLTVNLPQVIRDRQSIGFSSGVNSSTSTLYRANPSGDANYPGNSLAVDPSNRPSTTRSGIGDMTIGLKWAPFVDERDDTKSTWVIGLDWIVPSGRLAEPSQILAGQTGGVGMGHFVFTPFMLFSHRFRRLDPYVGVHGSVPVQGREAHNAGFVLPYSGGFVTGMEMVPWDEKRKNQKFAIDLRLTADFISEVKSQGNPGERGTVTELSDFLVAQDTNGAVSSDLRQLQSVGNFAQFGLHLGFIFRAAEYVRMKFGVSLAHNSEHFITNADACLDNDGDGKCNVDTGQPDTKNPNYVSFYDTPGQRIRVEETTLFTYWFTLMATF